MPQDNLSPLESTLGNRTRDVRSRDPFQTYTPFNPSWRDAGSKFGDQGMYSLDPRQLSPVQRMSGTSPRAVADYFNQLRPSSLNVRNKQVMGIMEDINTPMEQLYASQLSEPLAENRRSSLDQLRSQMTQRGLYNSGAADEARLNVEMDYLKGAGKVAGQARSQEIERQAGLSAQLMGVAQSDIDYYRYLVAGRNAALGISSPVDIAAIQGLSKGVSGIAAAALFGNRDNPEVPYYGGGGASVGGGYNPSSPYEGGFSSESGSGGQSTLGGTSSFGSSDTYY